ncbi:hypothetical protein Tco_0230108, partial [Tanacetum coccineum]
EQHFVLGVWGQSCNNLMPFVLEERGLKRHFQQTSLVVVVREGEANSETLPKSFSRHAA